MLSFTIEGESVTPFSERNARKLLTKESKGCNEPFKDRYWCPKMEWFMKEACPFMNKRECKNFENMAGERLARL
ncbi:hypothetical protein KKC45_03755 [Patescibacteria group bacterium]|nr:hypothetical protein [Patescibacteria group bacterium]